MIVELHTLDFTYFFNRLYFCMNLLLSTTVIYYQITFYVRQENIYNTIGNIVYVDQSLESLGVPVPHTRNKVECITLVTVMMTLLLVAICKLHYYFESISYVGDLSVIYKMVFFANITGPNCVLYMYYYYIINVIRQRVRLTRRAAEKFDRFSDTSVAWSDRVIVPVIFQPRRENVSTELNDRYKIIVSVYRCMYDVFWAIKQLYTIYFRVYICLLCFVYSMKIFYSAVVHHWDYGSFSYINMAVDVLLVIICGSVTSEFQRLGTLINSLYYKREIKSLRHITRRMVYESASREATFNLGLFELDVTLLPIIYDVASLFAFALFGSRY